MKGIANFSFRLVVWAALACLIVGIAYLEQYPNGVFNGYVLALIGAGLLVCLPASVRCHEPSHREWWVFFALSLAGVLFLAVRIATYVLGSPQAVTGPYPLLYIWSASVALAITAAFCLDRIKGVRIPMPPRSELLFCMGVFTVALSVRSFGILTLVPDEALHAVKVLFIPIIKEPPLLGALPEDGYPNVLLHILALVHSKTAKIFSIIDLLKWFSYICSSLSIVLWYAVVRIYSGRTVAVSASLLLVFLGWHWVNSKFGYAYPPDLAVVALAIFSLVIALKTESLAFAAVSGLSLAAGFLLQKSGLLLVPFLGYVGLEALISAPRNKKMKVVLIGSILAAVFAVAYEPILIEHITGTYSMPLQDRAIRERAEMLPKLGYTQTTALIFMIQDAFKQFQVAMHDFPRHIFRTNSPILDPIFSALFTVGFVHCLVNIRRSVSARICLIGLFAFILPMAFSFPFNDDQRGLARRMLSTSFFLAWIAALGALTTVKRLCPERKVAVGVLALSLASALTNIWLYFSVYSQASPYEWHCSGIRGIQSAAMIELALAAEADGISTIVLEGPEVSMLGLPDNTVRKSAGFVRVKSASEIRAALIAKPGELELVIIPWDTRGTPRDSQSLVQELSDIIPTYLWTAGRVDHDGVSMLRYAYVRVK
jgi:hypothetical protein